jgi:hypothetical protein
MGALVILVLVVVFGRGMLGRRRLREGWIEIQLRGGLRTRRGWSLLGDCSCWRCGQVVGLGCRVCLLVLLLLLLLLLCSPWRQRQRQRLWVLLQTRVNDGIRHYSLSDSCQE